MYGKIFASIFDGSLYGNWKAIVTFQQMIVLCNSDGVVDMTPQALAARTSIPLDVIQEGLTVLESPDQYSRTPDQGGRRIERLDDHRPWGWRIVNYRKYRQMVSAEEKRAADRERIAHKRASALRDEAGNTPRRDATDSDNSRQPATCRESSQAVANVAQVEAEAEVKRERKARASRFALTSLPSDWREYCAMKRPDLDAEETFAAFGDHWRSVGQARADWMATWRNWVRREHVRSRAQEPPRLVAGRDYV